MNSGRIPYHQTMNRKFHINLPYIEGEKFRKSIIDVSKMPLIMECTSDIPNPLEIQYEDMRTVKRFLLSTEGEYLVRLAKESDLKINFHPGDCYNCGYDYEIDITNEFHNTLHKTPNIKIWNTEWHCDETNWTPGVCIIFALFSYVEACKDINFTDMEKKYHFLTLNNIGKPEREQLYEFFQKNPNVDSKSLSSFLWKNKTLDNLETQYKSTTGQKEQSGLYNPSSMFEFYSQCAFEIVCESGPNMVTEKIIKPLIAGVPFLIHTNHLYNLNKTLNLLDIDVNYFGIKYDELDEKFKLNPTNHKQVQNKIIEITNTDLSELQTKYKSDYEKAKINRQKILKYWKGLNDEFATKTEKENLI